MDPNRVVVVSSKVGDFHPQWMYSLLIMEIPGEPPQGHPGNNRIFK